MGSEYKAKVFSPSNIALAKYWGKRHLELNLPTNSSLSATLADLGSTTELEFLPDLPADELTLNGQSARGGKIEKVRVVLDEIRRLAKAQGHVVGFARVKSENNFPTAAGLASSASGLSALALAGAVASRLDIDMTALSAVARLGSGSATRSLFGGFVQWDRGVMDDGRDSIARQIAPESHWPLDVRVAVVASQEKQHLSTGGMEHTRKTSPYFEAWVESAESSVGEIRQAILERNFSVLAEATEVNCLRFHCSAMSAQPPILYWRGQTLELVHRVRKARAEGLKVFFTIDAGPNVVVFVEPRDSAAWDELCARDQENGLRWLKTSVGAGARRWTS